MLVGRKSRRRRGHRDLFSRQYIGTSRVRGLQIRATPNQPTALWSGQSELYFPTMPLMIRCGTAIANPPIMASFRRPILSRYRHVGMPATSWQIFTMPESISDVW